MCQKWSEPVSFFPLLTSKRASRHKGVGYVVGSDHGKCGYSGNLQVIDLMHIYDAHIHIYIYIYNIVYKYIEIITTYKPQKMKQQLFTVWAWFTFLFVGVSFLGFLYIFKVRNIWVYGIWVPVVPARGGGALEESNCWLKHHFPVVFLCFFP